MVLRAPVAHETTVVVDGAEILRHRWFAPSDAIAAMRSGEIGLAPPTYVTICWLEEYASVPDTLAGLGREEVPRFEPNICPARRRRLHPLSGDAGYEHGDPDRPGPRNRLWHDGDSNAIREARGVGRPASAQKRSSAQAAEMGCSWNVPQPLPQGSAAVVTCRSKAGIGSSETVKLWSLQVSSITMLLMSRRAWFSTRSSTSERPVRPVAERALELEPGLDVEAGVAPSAAGRDSMFCSS